MWWVVAREAVRGGKVSSKSGFTTSGQLLLSKYPACYSPIPLTVSTVAKTLQLTTFPSIVFFSLLPPPNNPIRPSSSSSSSPRLQILTALSGPSTTSTSPTTILQLLSTSILPRTKPFLQRIKREKWQLKESRLLRLEQDKALRESERRDKERILASRRERAEKEKKEKEEMDRVKNMEEERVRRREISKKMKEQRTIWRKWAKANLVQEESSSDGIKAGKAIRVQLRLPQPTGSGSGSKPPARHVRVFPKEMNSTKPLFIWAETLLLDNDETATMTESDQARFTEMLDSNPGWANGNMQGADGSSEEGMERVRLWTTYPRKEVLLIDESDEVRGKEAWGVVLAGGGSLVMEIEGGAPAEKDGDENGAEDDDEVADEDE